MHDTFRLGIVEGFFGRQWRWQERRDYAPFLASMGCNSYVYAPKNDDWFRKFWQYPSPAGHLAELQVLRAVYGQQGIDFGIGFSPYELYRNFSPGNRELLRRKIAEINRIDPDTLYILFDDMMGDLASLAATQLEIIDCIRQTSTARAFAICPTYYSTDPVLSRYFGAEPEHYLEDIGDGLPADIEVFWTGPKIISDSYPASHLQAVAARLQRKPLLWDNYPVNDARRLCPFLHLAPFNNRDPAQLRSLSSGHLANPMNQPYLSQLSLWSLFSLYQDEDPAPADLLRKACTALCPEPLALALLEDAERFQSGGLGSFSAEEKQELLRRYAAFDNPMAREVCRWLKDWYAFDPACLT
jgi:hyaluronoglucosaminidase